MPGVRLSAQYQCARCTQECAHEHTGTAWSVIVNAIAALFFRQAEQTRLRATELYDRLRKDRQMTRAEAVVNTIEDSNIRSLAKAQIALHNGWARTQGDGFHRPSSPRQKKDWKKSPTETPTGPAKPYAGIDRNSPMSLHSSGLRFAPRNDVRRCMGAEEIRLPRGRNG